MIIKSSSLTRLHYFSIILLFVLGLSQIAFAATDNSLLLAQLKKKYSTSSTIKADVQLKVWWQVREKEETKKGSLLLTSGDKFRVTLGNEIYVSDGTTCYQYHTVTKLLQIKNLRDIDQSMLPSHIITSFINTYPLKEVSRSDKDAHLGWKADSSSSYKSIDITVDSKNCMKSLVLTDNNDNIFTYTFTKTEFGGTVPKGAFEFETPSDAQVNDAR
ncbi:MAG TPA: outer membrane lipoprotein carrier protein LolA [Chitinispirillaceae bacterium]|nr:outer membrane lipoprotein carrier protein LolA [Chitinispirillaceae bacterium]